jgi:uncharacterized protein (DUF58 family)
MRSDPQVQHVVNAYQLGLPRMPVAGRSGELLGRGTGTSVEFQEYREYLPGDDVRHLDWSAYARSDTLMVRLYREEISPRMEVLVDASASMAVADGLKSTVARQLASVFAMLSGRLGGRPVVLPMDDHRPTRELRLEDLDRLAGEPCTARSSPADLLAEHALRLKRQAVRVVLSDFLFPHDPESLVKRLVGDASTAWVIQILTAWEANPPTSGGRRLIDAETETSADLVLDRRTVTAYLDRLHRLQEELATACRRAHATFVTLIADAGLLALCRDDLVRAEVLRPA